MLEQRRGDVFDERHVERAIGVRVFRMRDGRVHRGLHARGEAMLERRSGNVYEQWPVGRWRHVYRSGLCRGHVHWRVHPRGKAV